MYSYMYTYILWISDTCTFIMHILCESLSDADSPNVLGGEEEP